MTARARWTLLALSLSLTTLPACREEVAIGSPSQPFEADRAWAETLRGSLDEDLKQRAEDRAGAGFLHDILAKEVKKPWNKRVNTSIKYADLFQKLYKENGAKKLAASHDGLTPRGQHMLAATQTFPRHMLSEPMDYHIEAIQDLDAKMKEAARGKKPWQTIDLSPEETNAVVAWMREHDLRHDAPETREALLDALLGPDPEADEDKEKPLPSPAPRITAAIKEFSQTYAQSAESAANLELLAVDGALRFARDLKNFNISRLSWSELKKAGGSKTLIYARQEAFFKKLAEAKPDAVPALFDGLAPQTPQYTGLLAARERYAQIIAEGGWPSVARVSLRRNTRSPRVKSLRKRLQIEGYIPHEQTLTNIAPTKQAEGEDDKARAAKKKGAGDDVVDDILLEAVAAYHQTHQLRYDGKTPHKSFWKSLNVSPKKRLAQIELNIKRWQESRYDGEQDFIFVNLPSFHAEVFKGRERQMKFKVVIGKNNRVCDPDKGKWVYPNATPRIMSELDYFILNPSWYVPKRIIEEEIKPNVEKDETYLERRGYEILEKKGKEGEHWVVRQKPGPDNALGMVKFIFPNKHNTYMHDTSKKRYFDYELRSFSHGCVRVHEPISFAKYLVEADAQQDAIDVDKILEEKRSKMVKLEKKIPVFLEYYTVQIDEKGRPSFLIDVYDLDERAFSEDKKAFDSCNAPLPVREIDDEVPDEIDSDQGP